MPAHDWTASTGPAESAQEPYADLAETHAVVFFAGDRAYKLKKPVRIGIMRRMPARHLAALTLRHLRAGAVTVVLVGGLPGTGKSALADALADRLGWTVLSSDRIRKELAAIQATQPAHAGYGRGIYAPAWTQRTYAELLRRAAELISHGESVILDATWASPGHRAAAAAMAAQLSADLVQLRCAAPAAVTEERIRRRTDSLSDASPEVAARMAGAQAPWPDAVTIDTASSEPGEHGDPAQSGRYPADVLGLALKAVGRP